jgi:hypothetical protein
MSLLSSVLEAIKPSPPQSPDDAVRGSLDPDVLAYSYFGKAAQLTTNAKRYDLYQAFSDMSEDGAIADKVLERLCMDATQEPVQIKAASRRRTIILDLLRTIKWEEMAASLAYLLFSKGDLFIQKVYTKSSNSRRLAYISRIVSLPPETIIRRSNAKDEFDDPSKAYHQVDDIRNGDYARVLFMFPQGKILHARNDVLRSKTFGYGRSCWHPCVRIFNMALMLLEDSAIGRHQSTQNLRVHQVGKDSSVGVTEPIIKDYARKVMKVLKPDTTDLFIDGKTSIQQYGGTKNVLSGVDDIRLMLAVLSIALDYPIDLMNGGSSDDSGGEELFRKEVVLSRTIQAMIRKINTLILRPLIDTELALANSSGEYEIITKPVTFEDKSKKSKRGITEVQSNIISKETYFEENKSGRTWEEEKVRIVNQREFETELNEKYPVIQITQPQFNPEAGESGNPKPPDGQQQRETPGSLGTDPKED